MRLRINQQMQSARGLGSWESAARFSHQFSWFHLKLCLARSTWRVSALQPFFPIPCMAKLTRFSLVWCAFLYKLKNLIHSTTLELLLSATEYEEKSLSPGAHSLKGDKHYPNPPDFRLLTFCFSHCRHLTVCPQHPCQVRALGGTLSFN